MRRKTFSTGGIHPAQNKLASTELCLLELPMQVMLPLVQHIGAPAVPSVAKGGRVIRGQLVAVHPSYVSANIHSPITGTVVAIGDVLMANGKPGPAITVRATAEDHEADTAARRSYWDSLVPGITDRGLCGNTAAADIRSRIAEAGIVGMGGALFPSHVKLDFKGATPDLLIVNGCECEPYLMCDDALMRSYPARIVEGVELILKGTGIRRAIIAVEDNKPEAAAALSAVLDKDYDISVRILRTRYPQGCEKHLVEAITGRHIPSGGLPLDVGTIVHNVATAFAVWQAVDAGVPLIERVVTVSGDIPEHERRNYIAAIGTPMSELPFTLPEHNPKIIAGGPMMGRTVLCTDAPITKGTSGITVLSDTGRRPEQPCMRCGKCVQACPMGLEPYLLAAYGRLRRWGDARDNCVTDCIECGSCSYICPSARPLLDYIRLAKQRSRKIS